MNLLLSLNKRGVCPDCGSALFHPGPRGGLAWNIQCVRCGSTFWYSPPFEPKRIEYVRDIYRSEAVRLAELDYPETWRKT